MTKRLILLRESAKYSERSVHVDFSAVLFDDEFVGFELDIIQQ